MESICRNCETNYAKEYNYCPNCSQKSTLHRLTFHDVLHEGLHYFTHADKGLFQLIRDLAKKSGIVAREYIEGKRKKYFPPLTFFFLIAAVFVFVATVGEPKVTPDVLKAHPELNKIVSLAERQNAIHVYERGNKVQHFTNKYSNLMAMCSLPLTALIFWLFYRKARYNYIEHLVAGMYMLGFCILIYALLILPTSYLFHFGNNYAVLVFFVFQLFYFTVFYHGFLNKKSKTAYIKSLLASIVSIFVWVIFSASIIRIYITSGFWGMLK
ncbi:DUF3667 domain-containing protein [Flavobacterium sp.]|uniref:DUF3667 domain-containing protein n=1 Tax=Flavobacterium sp. TaxID=239 RepID=UPI003D6B3968